MAKPSMQLLGDKELTKTLKTLGERVQRKLLRQAVNAASTPVVKAARSKAPKQSGLLKKSLGKKIKTYPAKMTVVGIIGPRTEISGEYDGKKRVPWRYAHLVEGGHIDEQGNVIGLKPFLRPAYDETQGQALQVLKNKLADGVVKEAKKGAA